MIGFDDTEMEKYKFHQDKKPISIDKINYQVLFLL